MTISDEKALQDAYVVLLRGEGSVRPTDKYQSILSQVRDLIAETNNSTPLRIQDHFEWIAKTQHSTETNNG